MTMILNDDSIDFIPEMPDMSEERVSIPINCWQDNICLSKIWIPSNLLFSRKEPSSNWESKGIFHTLKRTDSSECIKSFSVYSNSDDEEEEIFLSDSDEDILYSFETGSSGKNEEYPEELSRNILPALANYSSCDSRSKNKISESLLDSKNEISESFQDSEHEITLNTYASLNHPDEHKAFRLDGNFEILPKSRSASTAISASNSSGEKHETFPGSQNETSLTSFASLKSSRKLNTFNSSESDRISNKGMNSLTSNWGQLKKTESYISLNEILDDTPEISIKDFKCDFEKSKKLTSNHQEKKSEPSQKKNRKKNKVPKSLGLDEFLSDYTQQDYQDDCCEDYFRKLLAMQNANNNVAIKSTAEFPGLVPTDAVFVHPEKSKLASSKSSVKSVQETQGTETEKINEKPIVPAASPITVYQLEKIVIENIPKELSEEDVHSLIDGYGETVNFSLQQDGEFLKAFVQITLSDSCDIDWIVECLDGSEPFGAWTRPLKCYRESS